MNDTSRRTRQVRGGGEATEILRFRKGAVISGRYKIIARIGSGGFGSVFKASDLLLNKDVALKFLDPEVHRDEKKFLRVKREVNISRKISDERVAKIFDIGHHDSIPFLVMELIDGKNLRDYLRANPPSGWDRFRPLFLDILEGISALHEKGIVHRDIKPGNILISGDGKVKIIDFGLARELTDTEKTSTSGEIIGSPKYMSPEQIRGAGIDYQSDIYQLGLILYYALNGDDERETDSSTIERLLERVSSDPRKLFRMDSGISGFLRFGIFRATERDKRHRFGSINEMKDYFAGERYRHSERLINFLARRKGPAAAVILILLLSVFSSFIYIRGSQSVRGLDFNGPKLTASNRFGVKLFARDLSPLSVLNAVPFRIDSDFSGLRTRFSKEEYLKKDTDVAVVFLTKKGLYRDIVRLPLNSREFSSNVSLIGPGGKTLFVRDFHLNNTHLKKSLFSGWMNFSEIKKIEVAGKPAIVFSAFQNMSMYPSEICVLDRKNFHSLSNPGHIEKSFFYTDGAGKTLALLVGMNNLFCHFRFVHEVDFTAFSQLSLPPTINRGTSVPAPDRPMILIPHKTRIFRNDWDEKGKISFRSTTDERLFEVNRQGELIITESGGRKIFRDRPADLNRMYYCLNLAFQRKVERNFSGDPGIEVREALELDISSPVLQALMHYYAGDLYLSAGQYENARRHFRVSGSFLKENDDLAQKTAELYFLSGNDRQLEELMGSSSVNRLNFFGLGPFGADLFRIYVYLHSGDFRRASDLSGNYLQAAPYIRCMISLFKGGYTDALAESRNLIGIRTTPFTLSETRLIYARSVLLNMVSGIPDQSLNTEDKQLAEFYFEDIAVNSIPDGRLAALSRAYFMAVKGDLRSARSYAKETFDRLLKDSRGDFQIRLWLFYDAFIYARTMEILGNRKEAERGYEWCVRSNPRTGPGLLAASGIKRTEGRR